MSSENKSVILSKEWLDRHGLKAKGLGFYDYLLVYGLVLKHCDGKYERQKITKDGIQGNVNIYSKQQTEYTQVGAKYCECFVHMPWRNGKIVHVNISPVKVEKYEYEMQKALKCIENRINFIDKTPLFGPIQEDCICFLIDSSGSMTEHLNFIQEKICLLLQKHLKLKCKFNLISFDSEIKPWQDKSQNVTEENIKDAQNWVKNIELGCSTDIQGGLEFSLSDPSLEAIYLLTDGAPNQEPEIILEYIRSNCKIPIHTISFACEDIVANKFLFELSKITGGSHNLYKTNETESGYITYLSEDLQILKEELARGKQDLEKMKTLRQQCFDLGANNQRLTTQTLKYSKRSSFDSSYSDQMSANSKLLTDLKKKVLPKTQGNVKQRRQTISFMNYRPIPVPKSPTRRRRRSTENPPAQALLSSNKDALAAPKQRLRTISEINILTKSIESIKIPESFSEDQIKVFHNTSQYKKNEKQIKEKITINKFSLKKGRKRIRSNTVPPFVSDKQIKDDLNKDQKIKSSPSHEAIYSHDKLENAEKEAEFTSSM